MSYFKVSPTNLSRWERYCLVISCQTADYWPTRITIPDQGRGKFRVPVAGARKLSDLAVIFPVAARRFHRNSLPPNLPENWEEIPKKYATASLGTDSLELPTRPNPPCDQP